MIVHLSTHRDGVLIQVQAEAGKLLGDFTTLVKPGETKLGRPYEWWAGLGEGEHVIGEDA